MPEYATLIKEAVTAGKKDGQTIDEQADAALEHLLVEFGSEILKIIPGKISTEIDAHVSFDTQACVNKALHIIKVRSSREIYGAGLTRLVVRTKRLFP